MDRARRAGFTALIVVVLVAALTGSRSSGVLAGVVGWPTSSLVVSEVQTGGASASDEFVEIAAQGSAPVDLIGLEVVYATSSGSTVTRKATWVTSTIVEPGRRLLIGNSSGVFGSISDATYSGGFAATGGAIAIRVVGGAVVDSIGWGDATSTFVEGTAAPAPPAASSLERRPGGSAGNGIDTNDNAVDWFVQAAPSPQGLSAPPIPAARLAEPDADAEPESDCDPDICAESDRDAGAHTDSRADLDGDGYTDADSDRDAGAYIDSVGRAVTHADRDSHAVPDPTGGSDRGRSDAAGRGGRQDRRCPDDVARRARIRPCRLHPGRIGRDRALSR